MQNDRYMEQLARMEVKPEALRTALDILKAVPQIQTELENPSVSREKKETIIQKGSFHSEEEKSVSWKRFCPPGRHAGI